ncbi:unnamed protein product [Phytophthora lilii]|uniref:Unnamed protein product n=1 Tax=Phytophthora lilii TaxID=2077276 RepID=A0A9W6TD84_9STRA|nr:unnamed protein product [Phytophthora lilii]
MPFPRYIRLKELSSVVNETTVAQLNRLLQSSATPASPSAQPAGASHGSQRSPSSRPTSPGKRPLSKSSAAGLSLAAAGLGSSSSDSEDSTPRLCGLSSCSLLPSKPFAGAKSPASASHAPLALAQQSSAPSATASPPGPPAASPAVPEVVDLSGDDQVDEAPASVDTSHEILLSTPKRRDGRPTREASVTASLRSKASLEELLASDDLVLVSSVSSPAQTSAAPSSPLPLPPASIPAPTDVSTGVLTGSLGSGSASSAPPRRDRSLPYHITATLSTTPGTNPNTFTPVTLPPPPPASRALTLRRTSGKLQATATKFLTPAFVGNGAQMAWCQIHNARVPDPLPTNVKIPCSVAGIRAYANYEDPNHPWQRLRRKMPDRPCTFDPGNDPLRPISLRPQGLSRVTKDWRQLRETLWGGQRARTSVSLPGRADIGFRLEPSSIGWMLLLRRLARTLPSSKRSSRLGLNSIAPETFAPTATVSKFPTGTGIGPFGPHRTPLTSPPELMLEPTILTFSFEVIPWIPKTADWVSEVSVVDDRQPWRNCWIDVPGQHPFNTTFAPCNPPVPLFVPRGFTASHRRHYAEPAVIGTRNYFALGGGAFEPPDTAWHSSSCFSGCSCRRRVHKGDPLQSSMAAATAMVGAASSTGDVSEASVTDTPAGSSHPRPDLSDLADAATAASL